MKLDGVYYPLNHSISWLTTCMEEIRQDIARIQRATDISRPTSIDRVLQALIDSRLLESIDSRSPESIDSRLPASIDDNLPHSHTMKSQPDFHTRTEIDQLVKGIYRALETTKERLDERCDDIYFPVDLTICALTSKIEAIQGELVEIQSNIARRQEASASIDRHNNKSTDIHRQTSEEISADTYARLMRHQFNLESLGDRLQKTEDTTTIVKDKWRIGDEAMRDFTCTWFNKRKEEMETCFPARCIEWKHQSGSSANNIHASRESLKEPKLTSNLNQFKLLVLGLVIYWIGFLFQIFGASTRDDHRARPSINTKGEISVDVHIITSIDIQAQKAGLVTADLNPKFSPIYKITPDEF
uniref:Uncharacterized protein n=1 Tax=Brassica campestris TaxID=3711 RepID=M4F5M5_BRACM